MHPLRVLSASEQVAAHLTAELRRGIWSGGLPGVNRLAADLGVNRKTVAAALCQLEREGLVANDGQGRARRITAAGSAPGKSMRIAILEYDASSRNEAYMVALQHLLIAAGHSAFFTDRTLMDLGSDLPGLHRFVRKTSADAWIIGAGSRSVLAWFSRQPFPSFALFGRREELPLAATGPDIHSAMLTATRHLLALGHRRIVIVCRAERRSPSPGRTERAVLEELSSHGIATGHFNLPDWEESPQGLQSMLSSLFRLTPPSALIIEEAPLLFPVLQFLANRGLCAPRDISLLCSDASPSFSWAAPSIAHIRWNPNPVIRRVVQWADRISSGQSDLRHSLTPAEFIPGGTIGPPPP